MTKEKNWGDSEEDFNKLFFHQEAFVVYRVVFFLNQVQCPEVLQNV